MTRSTSTQRGASRHNAGTAGKTSRARSNASTRPAASKPSTSASSSKRVRGASVPKVSRGAARPLTPAIVLVLVVVLAWVLYPAMRLEYQASRSRAADLAKLEQMKRDNDAARQDVQSLQTPEGVEKSAREDLGYAKDGENVYVVIPGSVETSGPEDLPVASADAAAGRSAVDVILDALFGVEQPSTAVEP